MNTRRVVRNLVVIVALAGVLAGALSFLAGAAGAAPVSQTAPTVNAYNARCWRTILQANDLLCIIRYQLPQQTTSIPTPVSGAQAWCVYLANQGGCTSTSGAVSPTDPTSLQYGTLSAWATICSLATGQTGCTGEFDNSAGTPIAGGQLFSEDRVPRIGHGLAGHYFSPGHGITWGSTAMNYCIEPSSDFSTTSTPACVVMTFNGDANTQSAQRDRLESDIVAMVVDIQTARGLPTGSYTTGSRLNAAGRILALEGYVYMDQVVPEAFQAAANQAVQTPYSGTPAGVVVLETRIAAQTDKFVARSQAAGAEWGISGGFYTTLVFMFFGAVAALGVFRFARDTEGTGGRDAVPLAVMAFLTISFVGVFLGGPSLSVILVSVTILAAVGGWAILAKIPSG